MTAVTQNCHKCEVLYVMASFNHMMAAMANMGTDINGALTAKLPAARKTALAPRPKPDRVLASVWLPIPAMAAPNMSENVPTSRRRPKKNA
jgi:hypothetical protein